MGVEQTSYDKWGDEYGKLRDVCQHEPVRGPCFLFICKKWASYDLLQDEYRFEVSQGNSFQRLKAIKFKRSAMTDTKA